MKPDHDPSTLLEPDAAVTVCLRGNVSRAIWGRYVSIIETHRRSLLDLQAHHARIHAAIENTRAAIEECEDWMRQAGWSP